LSEVEDMTGHARARVRRRGDDPVAPGTADAESII
jgi:hypothetical protein